MMWQYTFFYSVYKLVDYPLFLPIHEVAGWQAVTTKLHSRRRDAWSITEVTSRCLNLGTNAGHTLQIIQLFIAVPWEIFEIALLLRLSLFVVEQSTNVENLDGKLRWRDARLWHPTRKPKINSPVSIKKN